MSENIAFNNNIGIEVLDDSIVSGNNASGNFLVGIIAGRFSTISGNTASGNKFGIEAFCPSNLVGNTALNNSGSDISAGAGCTRANNSPAP